MSEDRIVPERTSFARKRIRTSITCDGNMTEQSHKDECDINFILRDYQKTGFIRHAKDNPGVYDDISGQDFQDAMNIVAKANSLFNGLPSSVRKRFQNDPARFHDWARNAPEQELNKLGVSRGVDGIDGKGNIISPSGSQEVINREEPAKSDPSGKAPVGEGKASKE